MRFWWTKLCARLSPLPSSPRIASCGTHTSSRKNRAWSVGMLKVHRYSSIRSPGVGLGTRKQVIPRASPSLPPVRANSPTWVATCIPVIHIFDPSIRQPATPSRISGTARVSIQVASLPWSGSVSPNATRRSPANPPRMNSCFCASVPNSSNIATNGKLPTTECSFWRSLWRPRPLAAKWSRITAIHRLAPSWPPYFFGAEKRQWPALSATLRASRSSSSHSGRGSPAFSKSVRAYSRRWSKKRMLSSRCSMGLISASMNASSAAR